MPKPWKYMTSDELWPLYQEECRLIGTSIVHGFDYSDNLKRAKRLNELYRIARDREYVARRKAREEVQRG